MQQHGRDVNDSIARHPSSLAPPERHRRFGPWGILASVVSAVALALTAMFVLTRVLTGGEEHAASGAVGSQAPEFDLVSQDGTDRVRLSELRGRVVVVAFERANCRRCARSEEALDDAWRLFRHLGVSVMGIRQGPPPVATTTGGTSGPWPVLTDPGGETADAYGVHDELETFVIDAQGKVVVALAGPVTTSVLVAQLTLVLGISVPPGASASAPETQSA